MRVIITESQFKRILQESVTVNQTLLSLEEKALATIDYLYNEGVMTYSDDVLKKILDTKDMSLVDYKGLCKDILSNFNTSLTDEERESLKKFIGTGSYPELVDHLWNAVLRFAKKSLEYAGY